MVATSTLARQVQIAHDARGRGDWRTAYDALAGLRAAGERLPPAVLAELGLAAWWLGRTAESVQCSEEAHSAFLASGCVDEAADSAAEISIVALLRGDGALGAGWLNRARRLLEGRDDCLAHGLVAYVDCILSLEGLELDRSLAGAAEIQRLGATLAEPTLSALGLMIEGVARVRGGEVPRGLGLLDEAMLPVVGHQVAPEFAGAIYCMVISVCTELGDPARARRWTAATEKWCAQFSDAVMFLGVCRVHRAGLLALDGDWDQAEAAALQACEDLAEVNPHVVAEGFYRVGEVRRLRGDPAGAEAAYQRGAALGRVPQPGRALLHEAAGDGEGAWLQIEQAFTELRDDPFTRATLLLAEAQIAVATGREADAERATETLGGIAEQFDSPGFRTWTAHARGLLLLSRGSAAEALAELDLACRGYQAARATYDVARLRMHLARCHRELGDHPRADAEDRAARLALTELGVAEPTTEPPGGLTAREREVIGHLTAGASNRQIGAALSITEKTVGRHLSNIYLKLGVGSRTAAAAWAHAHRVRAPEGVRRSL